MDHLAQNPVLSSAENFAHSGLPNALSVLIHRSFAPGVELDRPNPGRYSTALHGLGPRDTAVFKSSRWGADIPSQKAVACAPEAVKGLRSQSLAPMKLRELKNSSRALDCLPRSGWEVFKGSCAPRLKTARSTICETFSGLTNRQVQLTFSKN